VTALLADPSSPEFNASEAGLGMPYGVVIKQATHTAYIADRYYDSVFEFDVPGARITRQFTALDGDTLNGDGGTTGIAFDTKANALVAINEGVQDNTRGSIAIVDLDTKSVRTIPLVQSGQALHADYVAVNPNNNTAAFCTLYDGGRTARFIDLSSGSVQQSSPTMSLTAPVFNQNTALFVFGARDDGAAPALIVYDGSAPFHQAQKVVSSAPPGTAFEKLAINPNTNVAVAVNLPDKSASIFDLSAGVEVARIPVAVGMGQYGGADVAISPATNMAVVTSTFGSRLTVIDLNTLLPAWEIALPQRTRPLGVDIDYQLNRAVIAENGLSSNTRNGSILVVQLPGR
jgi:DNA-binding beta-propeller fold protein YncE